MPCPGGQGPGSEAPGDRAVAGGPFSCLIWAGRGGSLTAPGKLPGAQQVQALAGSGLTESCPRRCPEPEASGACSTFPHLHPQ